ncbi:Protein CBG25724 [Caenorhabditis briggsae]|uniref:Protein CBG25724 n=1 Tax=Caenorhabditis briggsae TaxID=6238 RepID=B6IGY7_CAEBR|nr:Protein CBG25724 [Caenorhabditis briggsae]CAR99167.1 Protein CBG25724 [Caenorhabditis briggsae]
MSLLSALMNHQNVSFFENLRLFDSLCLFEAANRPPTSHSILLFQWRNVRA